MQSDVCILAVLFSVIEDPFLKILSPVVVLGYHDRPRILLTHRPDLSLSSRLESLRITLGFLCYGGGTEPAETPQSERQLRLIGCLNYQIPLYFRLS